MRVFVLCPFLVLLCITPSLVQQQTGHDQSWNNQDTFSRPYRSDAYGPGIHSDATGRPFRWQTEQGEYVQPGIRVKPDGYGLGVGMDQYGRPVKPKRY